MTDNWRQTALLLEEPPDDRVHQLIASLRGHTLTRCGVIDVPATTGWAGHVTCAACVDPIEPEGWAMLNDRHNAIEGVGDD